MRGFHHPHIPSGGEVTSEQRAFSAFFRSMNYFRQLIHRRLAEQDMRAGQAIALGMLSHHDGITQSELADHLHVSRPTVTVMLQKMEKAGLIVRSADSDDQRYTRIHVTDRGRELQERVQEVTAVVIDETFGALGEEDRLALEHLLAELNANMERALDSLGTEEAPE